MPPSSGGQTIMEWAARRPEGQVAVISPRRIVQIAHGTGTLFTHWPVSVRGKYFPL